MNQENTEQNKELKEDAAAREANLSESIERLKTIQKETDDAKKKTLAEMTASDRRRLKVIEKCASLLEKEEIPFLLFASIDKTGTTRFGSRGWWQYNSFAYPDKGEDKMEAKVKKSNRVIPALFPTVLNHLSNITYGWAFAVYGKDEQPFAVHQYGEQIYPERKAPTPASQETVDVKATTPNTTE